MPNKARPLWVTRVVLKALALAALSSLLGLGAACGPDTHADSSPQPRIRIAQNQPGVALGMDRLAEPSVRTLLTGKRWAVLAHPASRGNYSEAHPDGTHIVDTLYQQQDTLGIKLVSIFAPEHGFRGDYDAPVGDSVDRITRLPVYSLYGPRLAPTPQLLANVDGILIDLQDVGVRYYTYSSTMAMVMKAARAAGKKVIVFDRPNPVGGSTWQGPLLDSQYWGGIASYFPIPTIHGMTLGELALLYNSEFEIHADLEVIPMHGWTRQMLWSDTGLPWITPSPALPTDIQAQLYAALGILEAMNLAVGRGQTNADAFKVYGAPWITAAEAKTLTARLQALRLPGLTFRQTTWTPSRSIYLNKPCHGFRVDLADFRAVDPLRTFVEVTATMRKLLGARLNLSGIGGSIGREWVRDALASGTAPSEILRKVRAETDAFANARQNALLYP